MRAPGLYLRRYGARLRISVTPICKYMAQTYADAVYLRADALQTRKNTPHLPEIHRKAPVLLTGQLSIVCLRIICGASPLNLGYPGATAPSP
jgi:hypothetical protein